MLNDDGARQVERYRATDSEVVNSAADCELADVAAGEIEWLDDVGVSSEGKSIPQCRQARYTKSCLIFERRLTFAIKHLDEDVVDQVMHRLAAAAVRQRDVWHLHLAAVPGLSVLCC